MNADFHVVFRILKHFFIPSNSSGQALSGDEGLFSHYFRNIFNQSAIGLSLIDRNYNLFFNIDLFSVDIVMVGYTC